MSKEQQMASETLTVFSTMIFKLPDIQERKEKYSCEKPCQYLEYKLLPPEGIFTLIENMKYLRILNSSKPRFHHSCGGTTICYL